MRTKVKKHSIAKITFIVVALAFVSIVGKISSSHAMPAGFQWTPLFTDNNAGEGTGTKGR